MIVLNNVRPNIGGSGTEPPLRLAKVSDEGIYFYSEKTAHVRQWFLGDGTDAVLAGPFAAFEDLLNWAIQKEFVEPKRLSEAEAS